MKRLLSQTRVKVREYWDRLMESKQEKMSRGAQNISKIITVAQKDQWRRKNKKK